MKKLTLAVFAVVIGLVMTSCGDVSPKETITTATDKFFTQAEEELNTIDNGEDFMTFFNVFETEKEEFLQKIFADYVDEEGNIKGISESDMEEIQNFMYDRASAYNKVESAKAAEIMAPLVTNYENAINALCDAAGKVDEEAYEKLANEILSAEEDLTLFADYDNVPEELQQRVQAAEAKLLELFIEALDR